jgi:hypothetical protein
MADSVADPVDDGGEAALPHEDQQLTQAAGARQSDDRLASFLYSLMRDHVPAGVVQQCLRDSPAGDTTYTNGFLFDYAEYVAGRLRADV